MGPRWKQPRRYGREGPTCTGDGTDNTALDELQLLDRDPSDDLIVLRALRRYRLQWVRDEMARYEVDACLLLDVEYIRYAMGNRSMRVSSSPKPGRHRRGRRRRWD